MIVPPRFKISDIAAFEWSAPSRTHVGTQDRQVVIRLRITFPDGRSAEGVAAEALAIAWLGRNPALSEEENLDQLRRSIEYAIDAYQGHGQDTAFRHFAAAYGGLLAAGRADGMPPLLAGFGAALLDRAVADALGRALGLSIAGLVRSNALGLRAHVMAPDLLGRDTDSFLATLSLPGRIALRHSVRSSDRLTDGDQADDGAAETLEQVIATRAPRFFLLHLAGPVAAAVERLCRIAAIVEQCAEPWQVALDCGESFTEIASVVALHEAIAAEPRLARLAGAMRYSLQPLWRETALTQDVTRLARIVPVVVDSSDGEVASFADARRLGYQGVSLRGCKGLYKSLISAMRCAAWNDERPGGGYFMTAEDFGSRAGLAVQQDLALAGLLGLGHAACTEAACQDDVFAGRPTLEASQFVAAHPDIYARDAGHVRLRVEYGDVCLGSLDGPGFASALHPQTGWMTQMASSAWMAFLTGQSVAARKTGAL
jgi:hypothetical protein